MGTYIYLFFEKYNAKSQQWELITADHPEFVSFSLRKKELGVDIGCSVESQPQVSKGRRVDKTGSGDTSIAKADLVDDEEPPKEAAEEIIFMEEAEALTVTKRAVPNIINIYQPYELFTILAGVRTDYFRSTISPVLYTKFAPKKIAEEEAKEAEKEKEATLLFGSYHPPALRGLPDDVSRPVLDYYWGREESDESEENDGSDTKKGLDRTKAFSDYSMPMFYTLEELKSFDWDAHSIAYSGLVSEREYTNFIKANIEAEEKQEAARKQKQAGSTEAEHSGECGSENNSKPRRYTVAPPTGYCQGVGGKTVKIITNEQMDAILRGEKIVLPAPQDKTKGAEDAEKEKTITVKQGEGLTFFTRVSWETLYSGTSDLFFGKVIPFLEMLSKGHPSHARIVFFFQ